MVWMTCLEIIHHFSIGMRAWLWLGHSNMHIFLFPKPFCTSTRCTLMFRIIVLLHYPASADLHLADYLWIDFPTHYGKQSRGNNTAPHHRTHTADMLQYLVWRGMTAVVFLHGYHACSMFLCVVDSWTKNLTSGNKSFKSLAVILCFFSPTWAFGIVFLERPWLGAQFYGKLL